MTRRQVEREIVHAQLRLMSTDDQAIEDAARYLSRALFGVLELKVAAERKANVEADALVSLLTDKTDWSAA